MPPFFILWSELAQNPITSNLWHGDDLDLVTHMAKKKYDLWAEIKLYIYSLLSVLWWNTGIYIYIYKEGLMRDSCYIEYGSMGKTWKLVIHVLFQVELR